MNLDEDEIEDDDPFNDDKYCLNEDDLADFYGADIYTMMTA